MAAAETMDLYIESPDRENSIWIGVDVGVGFPKAWLTGRESCTYLP